MSTALQLQHSALPSQTLAQASAPLFERHNLEFFAGMIEAAGLIPTEKEANGQMMAEVKRKARVMSKIVAGVAHGFDPISSQGMFHIIDGKITLSAQALAVKLTRDGLYTTRIQKHDDTGCILEVLKRRDDGEWTMIGTVEFNEEMARKAELLNKRGDMYKKYGPDMYYARAITRVCRRFAPHVFETDAVDWRLSKEAVQPTAVQFASIPQTALPPQPVQTVQEPDAAPAPAGIYRDPVVSVAPAAEIDGLADDDGVDAVFTPVSEPSESGPVDTELAAEAQDNELREAATALLEQVTGGDPAEMKKILKGRQIEMMSGDTLRAFYADLELI